MRMSSALSMQESGLAAVSPSEDVEADQSEFASRHSDASAPSFDMTYNPARVRIAIDNV